MKNMVWVVTYGNRGGWEKYDQGHLEKIFSTEKKALNYVHRRMELKCGRWKKPHEYIGYWIKNDEEFYSVQVWDVTGEMPVHGGSTDTVEIYSAGIDCCSVCSYFDDIEEITRHVNLLNPRNISSKWQLNNNKTFENGKSNPHQCNIVPNRKHYLFNY